MQLSDKTVKATDQKQTRMENRENIPGDSIFNNENLSEKKNIL